MCGAACHEFLHHAAVCARFWHRAPPTSLASLAVALTLGIAQDEGGTQPYIPVGADVMSSARARRVVELLERGQSYKQVADETGITASRVRNIERAWRREQPQPSPRHIAARLTPSSPLNLPRLPRARGLFWCKSVVHAI